MPKSRAHSHAAARMQSLTSTDLALRIDNICTLQPMVDTAGENLLPPMAGMPGATWSWLQTIVRGHPSPNKPSGVRPPRSPVPGSKRGAGVASALSAKSTTTGLAEIVGSPYLWTTDHDRLLYAGGKSTPDLLRRKQTHQDAPSSSRATRTRSRRASSPARATASPWCSLRWQVSVVGGLTRSAATSAPSSIRICAGSGRLATRSTDLREAELGGPDRARPNACSVSARLLARPLPAGFQLRQHRRLRRRPVLRPGFSRLQHFNDMVRGMHASPAGILDLGRAPASARQPGSARAVLRSGAPSASSPGQVRVHPVPGGVLYGGWSSDFATGAAASRRRADRHRADRHRMSDEVETGVNLATAHNIGEQTVTGGCLGITVFERHPPTPKAAMPRPGVARRPGGTIPGQKRPPSLGTGPVRRAPYLRDSLLRAGAICETLETATTWSNLPVLKAAVTEALTSALTASGTAALVVPHLHSTHRRLAVFTVVAGQRNGVAQQWHAAKVAATTRSSPTAAPSPPPRGWRRPPTPWTR